MWIARRRPARRRYKPIELAGYLREAVARCAHAASSRSFEGKPLASSGRGDELARLVEEGGSLLHRGLRSNMNTATQAQRDVGPTGERALPQEHDFPAVMPVEAANRLPRGFALTRDELHDDLSPLPGRTKERTVDAWRDHRVVAGEPLAGGVRRSLRGGEQRVEPAQQPGSLRLSRGIKEALGREECRHGHRLGVSEREVRQARHTGLEAVDDVEPSLREGEREVRAHAHGDRHRAAARDGERWPDRHEVAELAALKRTASFAQVSRAGRRRENRDGVAQASQLARDAGDVVVHVVRLRPRERRDETDSEAHLGRV